MDSWLRLHGFDETDHLVWNLLFCRAGDLLLFHRDQMLASVLLGNRIDVVPPVTESLTDVDLSGPLILSLL